MGRFGWHVRQWSFMDDVMCKNPYRMYIRSTQVISVHAEGNYHNIRKQGSP